MTPLVILGAGGFAREVFSWLSPSKHMVVAFVADGDASGRTIHGIPVLSSIAAIAKPDRVQFLVAVGDPVTREAVWNRATSYGLTPGPAVIHRTVVQGMANEIGAGSIVCPGVILTTNVKLGQGVIVNIAATVGHDAELRSFVTVSPGANISGNVHIGPRSYIGTGAAIREKIRIAPGVTVGMGSVVVKDLLEPGTYVGNPARKLTKEGSNGTSRS